MRTDRAFTSWMKNTQKLRLSFSLVILFIFSLEAIADPLPSWNDGKVKKSYPIRSNCH